MGLIKRLLLRSRARAYENQRDETHPRAASKQASPGNRFSKRREHHGWTVFDIFTGELLKWTGSLKSASVEQTPTNFATN